MTEQAITHVLSIDPKDPQPGVIERAAAVIRGGGLVAFPTETVYGLGGNALDAAAVRRIFAAKERAAFDPVIVHIADRRELAKVAREVPRSAMALAERFWPGPLTLVLPKRPEIPSEVTAGLDTVAVRLPSHPVALALIRAAGVPIAAPSANRFTRTSATTAQHVLEDLDGRIDLVLDGGSADVGLESTVVSIDEAGLHILRLGAISAEELAEAMRDAAIDAPVSVAQPGARLASPGMLKKHYAPRAELRYIRGPREAALARIRRELDSLQGRAVGLLLVEEDLDDLGPRPENVVVALLGPTRVPEEMARRLYSGLRTLDAAGVEVILARQPEGAGLAPAIDDRLRRASSAVIQVA